MPISISWPDIKLSARLLRRYPGLTLVATFGITVGIGISAGLFAALASHVHAKIPLDQGDRIVALENRNVARNNEDRRVLHDFFTWRDEMTSVVDIGAFRTVSVSLKFGAGQGETIRVAEMSASGFQLARVAPLLGRVLTPDDERGGATPVLVIGYDAWRSKFAAERSVLGRQVRLGDVVHTIVGVMPERFAFPVNHQYWTPLRLKPSAFPRGAGPELFVFGRLRPGATMASAQAEFTVIGRRTAAAFPQTHAQLETRVFRYTDSILDVQDFQLAPMLQGIALVTLVLVVVALNVAILVYARTAHRRDELAIRAALGASRVRIVTQLFVEAVVLAIAPAALGLALAQYGLKVGTAIEQDGLLGGAAFWTDNSVQPETVVFLFLLVALTAGIVGVLPALHATRRAGAGLGRGWSVLVVAQIAVAVAALPSVVRIGVHEIRPSFTRPIYPIERFVAVAVSTSTPSDRLGTRLTELTRQLRSEPAVERVTFAAVRPGRDGSAPVEIEGLAPTQLPDGVISFGVDTNYLEVYGARLIAGRSFETGDARAAGNPVIVDATFARTFLSGTEAVGRRFRFAAAPDKGGPSPWLEIIGVTQNLRTNPIAPELLRPTVLYPVTAEQISSASLRLELHGSAASTLQSGLTERLYRTAAAVDPSLRVDGVRPSLVVDRQEQLAARLVTTAVSLLMVTGFLLSAAGIYALMSFVVAQRRREIGIRAALGASGYQVLRSVFSRVALQVSLGVVTGVAGAIALEFAATGGVIAGLSAIVIPAIAAIMTMVGLVAAFGPARRGLRIQPAAALKAE